MNLDENPLISIFKNQISRLVITIIANWKNLSAEDGSTTVFTDVLSVFTNLHYLEFHSPPSAAYSQRLSFGNKLPTFFSPTLMEFHVNVCTFNDCLHMLDGRFNQLRTFHVKISMVLPPSPKIDNKVSYSIKTKELLFKDECDFL